MVALHEVLNDEFPVAANFVLDSAADLELVEPVAVDRLGVAESFGYLLHDRALELGRVVGEADPHISEPLARVHRKQSSFGDLEVGHHGHVRRPDEAPVEPVAPDVVRALEGPRDATLGLVANSGTAVPAHVEESPDLPVGAAHDDQVLAADVEGLEAARSRKVGGASDAEPVPGEDPGLLCLKHVRVDVVAAGKRCQQAASLFGLGHGLFLHRR